MARVCPRTALPRHSRRVARGVELRMYEALELLMYEAASVWGLKLLLYGALNY